MSFKVDERPQEWRKLFRLESKGWDENSAIFNATDIDIAVLKSKYSVDTQHDCDSGSDSEWENGDETDFKRNAFDAFDDEPDL